MAATTDSPPVPLERAELIEIEGPDALAFAQAQFASDVAALAPSSWQWSAWLTAQGRVRAVFALLRISPDRLIAWLPLGDAQAIRDALARFVLRSKTTITVIESWMLARLDDTASMDAPSRRVVTQGGGFAFALPGATPRCAWLGPASGRFDANALTSWRLADIHDGLPWIAPATQDEFVPPALDLERIDAVRFDKGCYPGQEIAARLHFRGGNKRRLARAMLDGVAETVPGLLIRSDADATGVVLYGAAMETRRREALVVVDDRDPDGTWRTEDGSVVQLTSVYAP